MVKKFRDPMSALTHLIGALLSVIGLVIMLAIATSRGETEGKVIVSVLAFGFGMILLYTASFVYHAYTGEASTIRRLKKLDHSMIFILIAGSYTPFCLLVLTGSIQLILTVAIWATAVIGVLLMIFWIGMPRWLNTLLYIVMGWLALIALKPLYTALPPAGFWLLVAGGVFYTVGGLMYALKWPDIWKNFGFHEVFHVFVMLGSLCHYLTVVFFVLLT